MVYQLAAVCHDLEHKVWPSVGALGGGVHCGALYVCEGLTGHVKNDGLRRHFSSIFTNSLMTPPLGAW